MATTLKMFNDLAGGSQLTNIANTNATAILTANADKDRRINQIIVSTDDTAANNMKIIVNDGTNDATIGQVAIPASSGTTATAAVDVVASLTTVFSQVDNAGNVFFDLPKGWALKAQMSAVTSGKSYNVVVNGAAE